jgi:glycosidase
LGTYTVEQNKNLLEFYKNMIQIRNKSRALQEGDLNFLYANDEKKSFAFERVLDKEKLIVAFNIGEEEGNFEVPVNIFKGQYKELTTSEEGNFYGTDKANAKITVMVPAQSFRIYQIYPSY